MQKQGRPFPWWILIVGFLLLRWGILLANHPERAPGALLGVLAIAVVVLAALAGLKFWMEGKLKKLLKADFVPIDLAQFAAGMPAPAATKETPSGEMPSGEMPTHNVPISRPPLPEIDGERRAPRLPLALETIEAWTQQLAQLGFVWRLDYTFDAETQKIVQGKGVCRLLALPEASIYACIRQTIINGQAQPIRPALYSFLDDGGEIITIAAPAQDHNMGTHRPQDVLDFLPAASATDLLQRHRERRDQVQQTLHKSVREGTETEFYLNYERTGAKRLLNGYQKTSIFGLVKILATMNATRSLPGDLGAHVQS